MLNISSKKISKFFVVCSFFGISLVQAQTEEIAGETIGPDGVSGTPLHDIREALRQAASNPRRKLTRGLEVPESKAMRIVIEQSLKIMETLSASDNLAISSAKLKMADNRQALQGIDDFCRRILNTHPGNHEPAVLADWLMKLEAISDARDRSIYFDMLSSLSLEGRVAIEKSKEAVHLRLSSNDADWINWSRVDPEGFLSSRIQGCEKRGSPR
ncbi:MAG: hypothetical protein RQ899_02245 [Pseudomonadales bacterium]|nr:hypothetical protein [Pseudomonadales bacterium]